jgi:hypothetical protein
MTALFPVSILSLFVTQGSYESDRFSAAMETQKLMC